MALTNVEKLLIEKHGFVQMPNGLILSPGGSVRTVVDGKTTFTPLSPIEKLKFDSGATNIFSDTSFDVSNPPIATSPPAAPAVPVDDTSSATESQPAEPTTSTSNEGTITLPFTGEVVPASSVIDPNAEVAGPPIPANYVDPATVAPPPPPADPVASDAGVAPPPPPEGGPDTEIVADAGMGSANPNITTKQIPNPTNDSAIAALNVTLANPTGINPNTGQQYSPSDIFIAKEQYKAQTGLNFDTGQPDAPLGPTTNIDGETYTGIDTSNLNQYQGTGGTDTVVIDGTTYENFDKDKFRNDNATDVVPTQVPTGTTGTTGTTDTTGTTETTGTGTGTPPPPPPPSSAITPTPVTGISEADIQKGMIATGTGDITTPTDLIASKVTKGSVANVPTKEDAETYTAETIKTDAQNELNKVKASTIDTTGGLPTGATVTAQTLAPQPPPVTTQPVTAGATTTTAQTTAQPTATDVGQLVEQKAGADSGLRQIGLDAAQIGTAQTVDAPTSLTAVQTTADVQGDLLNTNVSSVDQTVVENTISKTAAATATPSEQATVQGQLATLTANFDASNPPAWAAGALRAANAQLSARGLSASSMAGQAILQATMESAIPIAQIDASTFAQFEVQNLSNRQQVAMFGAQQRAKFLELEFNQDFQMRVANASRVADIANINFSADQQIALENSRMAQSVDLANLNNRQAKVMADAAALTNLDMTELNNRQQAAVMNAQNFLAIEMANMNNEQQIALFKGQAIQTALLSDQAAENAQMQFNATSENQVNQHFATMTAQINSENADRQQAIDLFNAGAENAFAELNANRKLRVLESNSRNALIIEQANTAWRNATTTAFNAASNEANRIDAKASTDMTRAQMNEYWQATRDAIAYAYASGESEKDRIQQIVLTELEAQNAQDLEENKSRASILDRFIDGAINYYTGKFTAQYTKELKKA